MDIVTYWLVQENCSLLSFIEFSSMKIGMGLVFSNISLISVMHVLISSINKYLQNCLAHYVSKGFFNSNLTTFLSLSPMQYGLLLCFRVST